MRSCDALRLRTPIPEGRGEGSSGNKGSKRLLGGPGERDLDLKDFESNVTSWGSLGLVPEGFSIGAGGDCPFKVSPNPPVT